MSFNKLDKYDYNWLLTAWDFLWNKIYYEWEPIIWLDDKIYSYELLFRLEMNNFIWYEEFLKNIIDNWLSFSIFAKACNVWFKYSEDTWKRININTEISDLLTNWFEDFIFRLLEKFSKIKTDNIIIEILEHWNFNMWNIKLFMSRLKFLKELWFQIAIDDLFSWNSTKVRINNILDNDISLNVVKIDKDFIKKIIFKNETKSFDLKFISELRNNWTKIIVEWIENKNIFNFVERNIDFDYLQWFEFKNKNIIFPKMNNSDIII